MKADPVGSAPSMYGFPSQLRQPVIKLAMRLVVIFFAGVAFTACTSWRGSTPPGLAPRDFDAPVIRVTRQDHSVLAIHDPRILNDSVMGWSRSPEKDPAADAVAVALADVRKVERRRPDALKSAGALAGGYLALRAAYITLLSLLLFSGA